MKDKLETETIIGGIAAFLAIIAIITEVALNDFTQVSLATGLKDISTTAVALIVLIVAVRKLKPKKTAETFNSVLSIELDEWVRRSMPLVHKAQDYDKCDRYYMITNPDRVFHIEDESLEEIKRKGSVNSGTFNGRFVDLPSTETRNMKFYLNASTFKKRSAVRKEEYKDTMQKLAPEIANCISKSFGDFCEAASSPDGQTISVSFRRELTTPDDARRLVKLIEYVMMLYIIAA